MMEVPQYLTIITIPILRAVKDRMDYSEVVIAGLEQYLGLRSSATKKKGGDGAKP
jgi:hypothetical protein